MAGLTYRNRARIAAALTAGAIASAAFAGTAGAAPKFDVDAWFGPRIQACRDTVDVHEFNRGGFVIAADPAVCAGLEFTATVNRLRDGSGIHDGDWDVQWSPALDDQTNLATVHYTALGEGDGVMASHFVYRQGVQACVPGAVDQFDLDIDSGDGDRNVWHGPYRVEQCDTPTPTTVPTPTTSAPQPPTTTTIPAPTTTSSTVPELTASDVRTPPPVNGRQECDESGIPEFEFRSTGTGVLHVTISTDAGEFFYDVAADSPGHWQLIAGVDAASSFHTVNVLGATLADGSPVELVGSTCYVPEGPVSSTSVPAGAVEESTTTTAAPVAVEAESVTLADSQRAALTPVSLPAQLPMTGAQHDGTLAVIAAGLLAAGAGLVGLARRRNRKQA